MRSTFLQIFVKGFYKRYTKSFLLSFVMVSSYFLYMQTAGVFLTETADYWTMFVSIKLLTEPLFVLLFCLIAIFYACLAVRYVRIEIAKKSNQFLYYTFMGMPKGQRWKIWMITVLLIQLPLFIYVLYSLFVGYYYCTAPPYGLPILLFLTAVNVGTVICMDTLSRTHSSTRQSKKSLGTRFIPLNLVLLINHCYNNKLVLIATKILVLVTVFLFKEPLADLDFRLTILLALILACFNSALLYQDFVFQSQRMAFMLNFPKTIFHRFIETSLYYSILISPEIVYATIASNFFLGVGVFTLSYLIFLHFVKSLILSVGNRPLKISKAITLYFFVGLTLILYEATILLMILSLLVAVLLFYKYFQYSKFCDNQNS
ncbi:hypothetical protein [Sphingobacterium sp. LRF_L2]|uniref:hypothetical protein n=1 Tax=Sphingobacterium sp. LRF_L2 TaxID=3369421 RepID=UPI003F636C2F